jgi:histidinol-phosphate aminotransferase
MSPTPVTMASPVGPATYSWEATNEQVAARYGVPIERIARFDLNTSPEPPELAARVLATGRFETSLSEYPPSDYRRLVDAAARRYGVEPGEIVVGAGADEILDLVGKAFLPAGGAAVVPEPTYAMYRVLTEQRAARVVRAPRLGAEAGYAIDPVAVRAGARQASVVWLCSPNNPTGLPEPPGVVETLLQGLAAEAEADDRPAPVVVLDEAYAELAGTTLLPLREAYPRLVVVRTASKAYGLAGLRVGFAIAQPATVADIALYRPPGSVSTVSVTVVAAAMEEGGWLAQRVAAIHAERERLAAGLRRAGWSPGPSVTNFLLVPFGTPARARAVAEALLREGMVPRTFAAGHPLADCLRLTVRSPEEDDRLIAAARSLIAGAGAATDAGVATGAAPAGKESR